MKGGQSFVNEESEQRGQEGVGQRVASDYQAGHLAVQLELNKNNFITFTQL